MAQTASTTQYPRHGAPPGFAQHPYLNQQGAIHGMHSRQPLANQIHPSQHGYDYRNQGNIQALLKLSSEGYTPPATESVNRSSWTSKNAPPLFRVSSYDRRKQCKLADAALGYRNA
ncbi:hypothetical protein L596_024397 [Steinernema carpocapsae]|uniref:Uncharacterized protein n=1 Tax=Steinernema carpocapsae TaxID=34508 RepID=A0A4U5MGM4_STECR|nr:hypothetical protein L596_024397 [Steinernema carpocapsae]